MFLFLRREFHASVSVGSKVTRESSVEIRADSIMELSVCGSDDIRRSG